MERLELIKGKVFHVEANFNMLHQKISWKLSGILFYYFKNQSCSAFAAPFDVRLIKKSKADQKVTTVVQPDICVVWDDTKLDEKGCIGAPDFIIEIVSPGNSKKELKTKMNLYEENGVLEYWVIHPLECSVQQFYLDNNKYKFVATFFNDDVIKSKIFKGLSVNLSEVF